MKKDIHPKYNPQTNISCACGNTLVVGSTAQKDIKIELCSNCHPFYTGKQKLVDTARRVEKFKTKVEAQKEISKTRKGKTAKRKARAKVQADKKAKKEVTLKVEKQEKKVSKKKIDKK